MAAALDDTPEKHMTFVVLDAMDSNIVAVGERNG